MSWFMLVLFMAVTAAFVLAMVFESWLARRRRIRRQLKVIEKWPS